MIKLFFFQYILNRREIEFSFTNNIEKKIVSFHEINFEIKFSF